ncbi:MAG: BMP family ABC transporter substrate-binding protein [Anaerolineaceae bacterium]|nr:BMP family ABC transporter substrate-binding protein [Anaerolineaceae bacterium]
MFRPFKRAKFFLSSCLILSFAMLTLAPMVAAQDATAEATMAADSLPAECGNTPGTIRDLAAQIKADPTKSVKIGFLFVGPVDDFGYNYAANQGRLCLEAVYPGSTVYAENVPESAEAERVMENMIQAQGVSIIFPTSYGHYDPATQVAKKYPNVTFFHMGGPAEVPPNLGTFFGDIWQMVYVSGFTAGKMTKTGKLGYIVAFPISQTLLNVNAFELGAKAANPNATTTVVFTGSWCDPAKLSAASNNLVDQGIDVLTMHQDCPKPVIEVADRRGVYVVGYHADGSSVAPKAWLTGSMWVWGPTMLMLTDQAINGKYTPSVLFYGPKEGIVDLAPFGTEVPQDVQDATLALKAQVISGEVFPFTGPVKNQNGDVVIADGEKPDEATLQSMDYLVEGVVGTLPQ